MKLSIAGRCRAMLILQSCQRGFHRGMGGGHYSWVFNTWLACPGFLVFLGVLNHVLYAYYAYYYAHYAYDYAYSAYYHAYDAYYCVAEGSRGDS